MTRPIFILSSPRSGSTLLQRILLANGNFATLGEPSLLLRFLGDHNSVQRFATYRENNLLVSMQDMRKKWANFDNSYRAGVRSMMLDIYDSLSEGKKYFVDKTPRYTLIANEIFETFPDAKFIVLWRHPLAIASSISQTFYKGLWRFDDFIVDLTTGLDRLHEFENKRAESIYSLRYEDLVSSPEIYLQEIGNYLEVPDLSIAGEILLPKDIGGTLGDPSGTHTYSKISVDSRDKWIDYYSNWYRQRWAKNYFNHPRSKWLAKLGYTIPTKFTSNQFADYLFKGFGDILYTHYKKKSHKRRIVRAMREHHIYPYSFKPKD